MSRLADLRQELAVCLDLLKVANRGIEHVAKYGGSADTMDALEQASDAVASEIARLENEIEDLENGIGAREQASDCAYARWVTR